MASPSRFPEKPDDITEEEWNTQTAEELDEFIQKHLADGEICVLHEIGNEKLRYLNSSVHVISKDEIEYFNPMDDAMAYIDSKFRESTASFGSRSD